VTALGAAGKAQVRRHTRIAAPHLVPELSLHLITPDCPLWTATESEAAAAGIGEPYWAFAWPGGQALARFVLDRPEIVAGRTVLDFGGGSGVEAVAAALAGATRVLASDTDPVAAAAMALNADLNGVSLEVTTDDLIGRSVEADVILVGDMTYETELSRRVVTWLESLAGRGVEIYVSDPGRGFVDLSRWPVVAWYESPSDVDLDGRHLVDTPVARVVAAATGVRA